MQLPEDIASRYVLLLDPMLGAYLSHLALTRVVNRPLATGGSAIKAVEVLMGHGVPEDRIIFINLVRRTCWAFRRSRVVSSEDLLSRRTCERLRQVSPTARGTVRAIRTMQIAETQQITGWIDQGLNEKAYIIPGQCSLPLL